MRKNTGEITNMRKRIVGILLLLSVAGTLAGCSETNGANEKGKNINIIEKMAMEENEKRNTLSSKDSYYISDYVDPETGVHYLIYSEAVGRARMGGITPRFNADGNLMVDETAIPDNSR